MDDTDNLKPEDEGFDPRVAAVLSTMLGGSSRADGVGDALNATLGFIDENLKPDLIEIREPGTGLAVLAEISRGGISALRDDFFRDVRENPRFRRGLAKMTALDSFIEHVNRFGDDDTVIFADDNRKEPKLLAVLDYHRADTEIGGDRGHGEYRHGLHRSLFAFPVSDEWKEWNASNHRVMSMIEFAAFLEKRIGDIAMAGDEYPEETARFVAVNGGPDMIADYATLVELSRGLKVHEDAVVEEANVLSSGEGHIRFSNEHRTTRVGSTGDVIKVPTMFFIAIPIFNKGAYYRIPAALRYRKTQEGVKFWFDLWREDRSFDHAFNEAVQRVDAETEATVLFGSPEA